MQLIPLWASAAVIAALILSQAGRIQGNAAMAEMAITGSDYAIMTTKGGNEEIFYVVDKRGGKIFAYELINNGGFVLHDVQDIGEIIKRVRSRN